jgi:hypothetical protein
VAATAITHATELGQHAGLGLDKIRAFSRHRTIATIMRRSAEALAVAISL